MSEKKKLVVVVTNGFNDERSSVAWSVANGAIGSDMQVTMFLVSSGVDWVRKGAADQARLNPLDPPPRPSVIAMAAAAPARTATTPRASTPQGKWSGLLDGEN
jgi:predicted peroxiredoxin